MVDRTVAAVIVDKAKEAGIPIIFFNREPVEEDMAIWNQTYYLGTDAREDVYKRQIMHKLVEQGKSIIMISSEMPELLGMSDRIMVMCEGRVTGFLDSGEADSVQVMNYATKFMQ